MNARSGDAEAYLPVPVIRSRGAKYPALTLVAVLILLLSSLVVATPDVSAAAITVNAESATTQFPQGITFTLKATAPAGTKRVELLYTTAGQETLNLATPAVPSGPDLSVSYPLDLRANYQPPGIDIVYHWRITDNQGNVLETPDKTVLWSDTRYHWQSVETPQVTVFYYTGDVSFARDILNTAQSTIDKLQPVYKVPHSHPVRIWVYNSKNDFDGAQAPNSESWIAGASYPGLYLILALIGDNDQSEIGRVIPHEISHQVLYQATENPFNLPPTWLDEGLAVSNQIGGAEDFPAIVQDAADKGKLFSISALNSSFPYDPGDATLAYAESLSIVRYIEKTYGEAGMSRLIAVYRNGVSYNDAIQQALGVSATQLDQNWKTSLGYTGDRGSSGGVLHVSTGQDDSDITSLIGSGLMSIAAVLFIVFGALLVLHLTRARRHHFSTPPE